MRRLFALARRSVASAILLALLPIGARGDSDAQLRHVDATTAEDGSTRIVLTFDKPVLDTRVIRGDEHTVHIVFVGAQLRSGDKLSVPPGREIAEGTFSGFAGIGMRLNLHTRDHVTVRTEENGETVIVHVPARHGDRESLTVAARPAGTPKPAPAPNDQVTAVVRLSYADVSEVAGALVKGAVVPSLDVFNVISPFAPPPPPQNSSGSGSSQNPQPTYVSIPAATLLPKDSPQGVRFDDHIAVDRRLNAVIISGTQAQVDAYKAVIATLDQPAKSVLLEAQIVELTETGAKNLGIDFSPNGTLGTATFAASTNNKPAIGVNLGATLSLLTETGQAKILARPRILSLNNRPAAILSGEAVPIFTSVVIPGGTGTVVNQQVQYINVGISLQILPRIADDGRVTAQLFSEVSSIIDYIGTTPRIAVRQELTSAVVNDSESLIVGGLLQQTEIKNLKKVPAIGDIPLIGSFFRSVDNTSQNTNLYIVLTPHILSNGATTGAFDLPPLPAPTIPPADPALVPGPQATPPPSH